jgi:hypothetical protein
MSIKNRLAKLEKIVSSKPSCPVCKDSEIRQTCFYDEYPDGRRQLTSGVPPAPCPACGRIPAEDGIWEITIVVPPDADPEEEVNESICD